MPDRRAYLKDYRQRRRSLGLCCRCGAPALIHPGTVVPLSYCESCRAAELERARSLRIHRQIQRIRTSPSLPSL